MTIIVSSRQQQLVGVTVAFVGLGTIIALARVWTRHFIVRSLGKDDWAMIIGWTATVGYMCEILLSVRWGLGLHATRTSEANMVRMMKATLAIEITYYFTVATIKISILLFYLRLVQAQTVLRKLCYGTIALIVVFFAICLIVTLSQCVPMHKQWDFTGAVSGKCINKTAFFYFTSAFNIITDIWIIALPVKVLSGIHRPKREKIILFFVFGMGVLSCAASIVRLYSIRVFTLSKDPFYDGGPVNIWSMVEINVAIVCASVPALKPLLTSAHARAQYYTKSSSSSTPYRLGPLSPNENRHPAINTSVHSGLRNFPSSANSSQGAFDKLSSTEAINRPADAVSIGVHRDFTFKEERV